MDKNAPIKPSNLAADSLRNPLAALAETADYLAKNESHPKYRAQKRREASRLRELARQQPPPAQPPK